MAVLNDSYERKTANTIVWLSTDFQAFHHYRLTLKNKLMMVTTKLLKKKVDQLQTREVQGKRSHLGRRCGLFCLPPKIGPRCYGSILQSSRSGGI